MREVDLPAIDLHAEPRELRREVLRGDRAVHAIVGADAALQRDGDAGDLLRLGLGLALQLRRAGERLALVVLETRDVRLGRVDGELAGDEVVAGVTRADADDVAALAEVLQRLAENDLEISRHGCSLSSQRAIVKGMSAR